MTPHYDAVELRALVEVARADPGRFKVKVAFWALLGRVMYAAQPVAPLLLGTALWRWNVELGTLLALLVGVSAIILISHALIWRAWRASMREGASKGARLTRAQAPALYAELERLGSRLKGDGRVILDDGFNAQFERAPREWVPGFDELRLRVGLPLLENLDEEGMRAVLARLVNLEIKDDPLSAWIDRAQRGFDFERNQNGGNFHFPSALWDWYLPRFGIRVRALARYEVEEGDLAAGASGPAFADALTCIAVRGRRLELDGRPSIVRAALAAESEETEVAGPLAEFAGRARDTDASDLEASLREKFPDDGAIPPLRDRLTALGVDPRGARVPKPPLRGAASVLWEDQLPAARRLVDDAWRRNQGDWREVREKFRKTTSRLEALRSLPAASFLDNFDEVALAAEFEGLEGGLKSVERLLSRFPDAPLARLNAGNMLALASDERCLEHLQFVLDRGSIHGDVACRAAISFAERADRPALVLEWRTKLDAIQPNIDLAWKERTTLAANDEFLAHELPPADVAALVRMLADAPGLKRAWMCRKAARGYPATPLYAIILERGGLHMPWAQKEWDGWLSRFAERLNFAEATSQVFASESVEMAVFTAVKSTPGALVFEGAWPSKFTAAFVFFRWLIIGIAAWGSVVLTRSVWGDSYGILTPLLTLNLTFGFLALFVYDHERFPWAARAAGLSTALMAFWAAWSLQRSELVWVGLIMIAAAVWSPSLKLAR